MTTFIVFVLECIVYYRKDVYMVLMLKQETNFKNSFEVIYVD